MPKGYVLDTNVFIQSKNREYRFDFCVGFWHWIEAGHQHNRFFSCKKVHTELRIGDAKRICPARKWADAMPAAFFLDDTHDATVMKHYGALMNWVISSSHYTAAAKKEFADPENADAFLVAVAKRHGMDVVTHEKARPDQKSRVPIHSAAAALGVQTILIYDLLSLHAGPTFVFKA